MQKVLGFQKIKLRVRLLVPHVVTNYEDSQNSNFRSNNFRQRETFPVYELLFMV